MPRKPSDNSKISGIKSSQRSTSIEHLKGVSNIEKTQKTAAVSAIKGVTGIGKSRSIGAINSANREAIYKMLHEEADKLFGKSSISKDKRAVIEKAVKMAIDAVIIDEEGDTKSTSKKKDSKK